MFYKKQHSKKDIKYNIFGTKHISGICFSILHYKNAYLKNVKELLLLFTLTGRFSVGVFFIVVF